LLNEAVGRLYSALCAAIRDYSAPELLDELLLRNESLVHDDAMRDLTFASQLACAANAPSLRARLQEDLRRHARAAMAPLPRGARGLGTTARFPRSADVAEDLVRQAVQQGVRRGLFERADVNAAIRKARRERDARERRHS
jgi:hypothetical protein